MPSDCQRSVVVCRSIDLFFFISFSVLCIVSVLHSQLFGCGGVIMHCHSTVLYCTCESLDILLLLPLIVSLRFAVLSLIFFSPNNLAHQRFSRSVSISVSLGEGRLGGG